MVLFRVDANEKVASGHLMRCLAIARQVRSLGEQVLFVLAEEEYTERIVEEDFAYEILHSAWDHMSEELPKFRSLLVKYNPRWIVVDSYQAKKEYLESLAKQCQVLYIDDLEQEKYEHIHALLHYADWEEQDQYAARYASSDIAVLYGMKYAPLREEFYPARSAAGKNVLLTTGGADAYCLSCRILQGLCVRQEFQNVQFLVIVGAMNPYKEALEQLAQTYGNVELLYNVNNMGELMRKSMLAISAGGTTLLELCACRVPTVCFSVTENQVLLSKGLGERGIMSYCGDARYGVEALVEKIQQETLVLLEGKEKRSLYMERMSLMVDGKGCERVARMLCEQ